MRPWERTPTGCGACPRLRRRLPASEDQGSPPPHSPRGYPSKDPGTPTRVAPEAWHAVLDDPAIPVIDLRNDYEVAVGTFPEALNPKTEAFTDFPAWVEEHLDPVRNARRSHVCTGGYSLREGRRLDARPGLRGRAGT